MFSKDNKKYLLYIGLLYLAILLAYKIPHSSNSIIQSVIKPIRNGGSVFYVSSLIPLTLIIVGFIGITHLERNERRIKFLLFLLMTIVILPFMKWSIDMSRSVYYLATHAKLKTIDMKDSNLSISAQNDKLTVSVHLDLIDYGWDQKEFKLRVYLPVTLSEFCDVDVYEFDKLYFTHGKKSNLIINETFVICLEDRVHIDGVSRIDWYQQEIIYELFNNEESIQIVDHGL